MTEYIFLNYKNLRKKQKYRTSHANQNLQYRIKMKISQIGKTHKRRVFGLFDLMRDIGGVFWLIFLILGVSVAPIA